MRYHIIDTAFFLCYSKSVVFDTVSLYEEDHLMSGFRKASFLLYFGLLLALFLNACTNASTGSSPSTSSSAVLNVVAGENFWGSIATQLGGSHVSVTSVVSDPNADPHQYESSTNDARAFAQANYVILNG